MNTIEIFTPIVLVLVTAICYSRATALLQVISDPKTGLKSPHRSSNITTDYLESEKELDIEETSNAIKEFGLNRRPYYMLNNFSKQAQPAGGEGKTAGYFFFETSDKMIFKSIDSLFDEEKNPRKRSIIFNSTTDKSGTPEGYDYKALTYDKETAINWKCQSWEHSQRA